MEDTRNFTKNLKAIRTLKNMSMAEFSESLSIPKSTLHDILKGKSTSLYTAQHIANQLDIPLSTLLDEGLSVQALDVLSSLLRYFSWFADLNSEEQKRVAACVQEITEVLQK